MDQCSVSMTWQLLWESTQYVVSSLTYEMMFERGFDISTGYIFYYIHANGASLLFFLLYTHVARGLYNTSYNKKGTWYVGALLIVLLIAEAFIGYVLPMNQISY